MIPTDVGCVAGSIWKFKNPKPNLLPNVIVVDIYDGYNAFANLDTYDIMYKFDQEGSSHIYTRPLKSFLHYFELISNDKEYIL